MQVHQKYFPTFDSRDNLTNNIQILAKPNKTKKTHGSIFSFVGTSYSILYFIDI